jgi:hypothetical protein
LRSLTVDVCIFFCCTWQAEKLLGVTARDLFEMRSTGDQSGYDKVFADCLFKPVLAKVPRLSHLRYVLWT